ncbi:MAG: hypothetical protein R2752_22640 [Vicinamibacterales bacterium]
MASFLVVEIAIAGLAALPVVAAWAWAWPRVSAGAWRVAIVSLALVPSYVAFALLLMPLSAIVTGLVGWRAPADAVMPIAACDRSLLRWARQGAAYHVVRVLAGSLFCGSPLWTFYLRLNGARLGRRVYVNSLFVSDHNLLEFGDDVVIGSDVHLSGHTVEAGVVRTGRVRLGRGVTVGLGAVVDIDVEVADGAQIGAMSLVPKHSRLEPGVYVGAPVHRLR